MNPSIANVILMVVPSQESRVSAYEVRQWACPRFITKFRL